MDVDKYQEKVCLGMTKWSFLAGTSKRKGEKGSGRGEMRKDKLEKRWGGGGLGKKRGKKCWSKV